MKPSLGSLLSIDQLTIEQIEAILALARRMDPNRPSQLLHGKRVVLLFYEASTRTRASFDFAAKALGAVTTLVTTTSSSIEKGESLIDTGWTIECIGADVIVMRHPNSGSAHLLARYMSVPIVNAGDGMHQHPSQALLDALTILNHKKELQGITRGHRRRRVSQPGGALQCGTALALRRRGHLLRPARLCAGGRGDSGAGSVGQP